eukprot:m.136617 g.136617  ORF g.136617 m.136617 type:complete len:346 (-) comp29867_c1_seq1:180-1217(-)
MMAFDGYDYYDYPTVSGKKAAAKKKAKPKTRKDNWFQMCTLDELKKLAKASNVAVSGTKAQVEKRLLESDIASQYAYKLKIDRGPTLAGYESYVARGCVAASTDPSGAARTNGHDSTSLKMLCETYKLSQTGKKFDLVLRLLQFQTGKGGEPEKVVAKPPRAKPMALPTPSKLRERVNKVAFPKDSVMYSWSNYKSKQHFNRCCEMADKLIQEQVVDRRLIDRGEIALAWEVVVAVCEDWMMEDRRVRGIGYYHERPTLTRNLVRLAQRSIKGGADDEALASAITFFEKMFKFSIDYGYEDNEENDWRQVVFALRGKSTGIGKYGAMMIPPIKKLSQEDIDAGNF